MSHGTRHDSKSVRTAFAALALLFMAFGACSADPGHGGRTAEEWIAQLETSPDSMQRRNAADALGRILQIRPGSERVTAALVEALADTSDEVRLAAGTSLVQDNRLPGAAVPGLVRALADSAHEHTREHAAELLGSTTLAHAGEATRGLMAALEDPDAGVRNAAVASLAKIASRAPTTVTALRQVADSGSALARAEAGRALARIGRDSAASVPRSP
jgi:HEAT repeat protein